MWWLQWASLRVPRDDFKHEQRRLRGNGYRRMRENRNKCVQRQDKRGLQEKKVINVINDSQS